MKRVDDFRLRLGEREIVPIMIGGMGVDISTAELALEAARLGGIGHISDAMLPTVSDRRYETDFVKEMVRQMRALDSYGQWDGKPIPAILDAFGWDDAWLTGYKKLGFQVLSKSGGTMFFSTNLAVLPVKRMAVAVSISGHASAEAVTYAVMNALLKDRGLPFPEAPAVRKPVEPQPIPPE